MSETWDRHHPFYEKARVKKMSNAARQLCLLTTVEVPRKRVHNIIHAEVEPVPYFDYNVANELLIVARQHERGIERFDAITTRLARLAMNETSVGEMSFYLLDNLLRQREIIDIAYPRIEIAA